jgi:hypothetical protein
MLNKLKSAIASITHLTIYSKYFKIGNTAIEIKKSLIGEWSVEVTRYGQMQSEKFRLDTYCVIHLLNIEIILTITKKPFMLFIDCRIWAKIGATFEGGKVTLHRL